MPRMARPASALLCAAIVACSRLQRRQRPRTRKPRPAQLRSEYIARLQEVDVSATTHTVGSLWSSGGDLNDLSIDYKARKVNDTLVIVASVQTTARKRAM